MFLVYGWFTNWIKPRDGSEAGSFCSEKEGVQKVQVLPLERRQMPLWQGLKGC